MVKDGAPFSKLELVKYLEDHKIATRSIFAGNLARHPAYMNHPQIRKVGDLKNSDKLMNDAFWIGVYPGITKEMLDFVMRSVVSFIHPTSS